MKYWLFVLSCFLLTAVGCEALQRTGEWFTTPSEENPGTPAGELVDAVPGLLAGSPLAWAKVLGIAGTAVLVAVGAKKVAPKVAARLRKE